MNHFLRRLALACAGLLLAGAAVAQTFTGTMSGSWWNAARAGEGQFITFESVAGRNVAYLAYFTYTADGRATWHVGNADYTAGATSIAIPLVTGAGARFGTAFNSADVTTAPAGTATLEYVSCTSLRLRHSNAPGLVIDLTRLVGPLAGADCGATAPAPVSAFAGVVSGSWWNASRGGEGQFITFETLGTRNVAYLAYFTYTAEGAATWLVGNVDFTPGAKNVVIPLVTGSGARFGTAFRASDVAVAPAGSATLSFSSCGGMRIAYSGTQAFAHELTRLVGPLTGIACTNLPTAPESATDAALRPLLAAAGQTGNARAGRTIPSIDAPLPQLGKLLFFSKALSGNLDTACASCHHPALGGADGLSLSIGTGATNPNVMGPGRTLAAGGFSTGRNSPTFFNVALMDKGLFFDSRVESLGKLIGTNGAGSGIRTPATAFGVADPAAGPNLPAAQVRAPVVAEKEMKGTTAFAGLSNDNVRAHIAARLGNYGTGAGALQGSQWLARFRTAFNSPSGTAQSLITFENIMLAISEYERSATFTDNAWARYVGGDNGAISETAKQGALHFFKSDGSPGAANCTQCHKGDKFTDERHTIVGFPQVGPGMGDGANGVDDFGRERASGDATQRYFYRTPSLLNVELTHPYGHAGVYPLNLAIRHYILPNDTVNTFLNSRQWCQLPSFTGPDCAAGAATVNVNTTQAFTTLAIARSRSAIDAFPLINLEGITDAINGEFQAFLSTLTDPCLKDRACFGRWIPRPDEAPDGHQLNATNAAGNPL